MGLRPDEFDRMQWCDWQRTAQGYIIRQARQLDIARKISYWALIAAGGKNIRETMLFSIITDPPPPEIKEEDKLTQEQLQAIANRYFPADKKGK